MATYPYSQDALLVNSIKATTVVSIVSGMQVSVTTFTSPAGDLGKITLSPVQPTATNVEFKAGAQKLQIDLISFRAQFGLDSGQVTCSGRATDQDGNNETAFAKQIATWS
ncbi:MULTISPECIES: hypothetical protein [Flavobacterium]|jgi:hypothetical protein|uniref:DUF1842 domain-containing protein n=1 Tax=Flavobacterium cupriresistens TaxID=2893885 RepID=A0ABU4RBW7_9FLAO|nr:MULTISPECIES: hypothetical protein [unclassified Flavobacterium]KLT69166.1 hypothetical protein AB674_13840 [Flavobacterium sp. ABG]MDX6189343.1 hypothetical protein [Flavobacterium sp. Fl-318]UFH41438.1 hypothetical protein LNP23_16670 [Flavobacterium sp. F-323]